MKEAETPIGAKDRRLVAIFLIALGSVVLIPLLLMLETSKADLAIGSLVALITIVIFSILGIKGK